MKIIVPATAQTAELPKDNTSFTKVLITLVLVLTFLLIGIGLTVVFSTTAPSTLQATPDGFFFKQLTWVGVGSFFAASIVVLGPRRLTDWRFVLFLVFFSWAMLLAARFVFPPINGAYRWINIANVMSFQPSELMKFACILLIARWAYDNLRVIPNVLNEIKDRFWRQLSRDGEQTVRRIFFFCVMLIFFFAGTGMLFLYLVVEPEKLAVFPGAAQILLFLGGMFFLAGMIGVYAVMAGENSESPRRFYSVIWPLIVFGISIGLVFLGKDLGMSALICISAFGIAFVAGLALRWIIGGLVTAVMGVFFILSDPTSFRYKRLCSFVDPEKAGDSGYQIWMCLLALGSGGLFGRGLGEGRLKTGYLPEAHTDCILAVAGEELGFITLIGILLLFLCLIICCALISLRAANRRSMLAGAGMTIMLAVQMLINVAVVTSSMPAKGMPAPFISYGGSNMLISLMAIGIILAIAVESIYPAFHDKIFKFSRAEE